MTSISFCSTDSRDILNRAIPPSEIMSKPIVGGPVARLYCKNRFEYFVNKTRVLVGRSGGESRTGGPEVDISIDSCSLYISRRHFDIIVKDCNKFFVSVYSKNGLFVNGLFLRKGSAEFQLKNLSRLRFPKTDLKILFQLLEKDPQSVSDSSHQIPSVVSGENGDYSVDSQHNPQTHNMGHQQMVMVNESEKMQENMPTPAPLTQTKLEREVYKQYHAPPVQQAKKRKFRDPEIDAAANNHEWTSRGDYADGRKPPFSYSQLIAQAIFSAPEHMLCLNDIYMFITKTYPFYKPEDKGWQNSIRHNLSLSKSFVRLPRANEEGKGSLWSIEHADKQNLFKTAYRPRGTRDKYHHPPPPKIPRVVPEPIVGESEESSEVTYQNEDEEAANNIAMANQAPTESFNFVGNEHFGEGEDQMVKAPQAAILQSSFANPMQIFMQPDRRGGLNQQHINLSQLQRANVGGSGSVQVVRLTVNPNNAGELNYGTFDTSGHQESLDLGGGVLETGQEPQAVWQPQQIRIQQQPQVTGTGQRIIILRPAQQQQQISDPSIVPVSTVQQTQPKKILLASPGSGLTFLNPGSTVNKDHGQMQRIVIASPQFQQAQIQENITSYAGLENQANQVQSDVAPETEENQHALPFEMLSAEQQKQVLLEQLLQQQKQQVEQQDHQILQQVGHFDSHQLHDEGIKEQLETSQTEQLTSLHTEQPLDGAQVSIADANVREIPIMEYTENS